MQADPLQQLRDIHLPPDPSWWPPAPGWWIVAALIATLGALVATWMIRRRRKRAPIVAAVSLHRAHRAAFADGTIDDVTFADRSNALLKRVLVRALERHDAAPLTGHSWLAYLDTFIGTNTFVDGPGQVLGHVRFAPATALDASGLATAVDRVLDAARRELSPALLPRRGSS